MQDIKLVVRQVGAPNPQLDIISSADLEEYVAYQFTSQGYKLFNSQYLGEVKAGDGIVLGYKFALWFTRDEELSKVKKDKQHA